MALLKDMEDHFSKELRDEEARIHVSVNTQARGNYLALWTQINNMSHVGQRQWWLN